MYKKKWAILTVTILIIFLISVASFFEIQSREAAAQTAYKAQAEKLLSKAVDFVERLRNVTLPNVELEVVTKSWAIETWGKGYATPDLQNILREERIYKALLMIPENASLYQANVDWAGYIGAATWNGKIYVVQENFDPWKMPDAEATFVHELTHIMQAQLHPQWSILTFDLNKARDALNEGDASFMGDYFKNQTQASLTAQVLAMGVYAPNGYNLPQPSIPDAVLCLNYFPYTYGKEFVKALYQKGGWQLVNEAYRNPPNTTEQIMHPEKYFSAEPARNVTSTSTPDGNWTLVKTDTYGEYFIQVMLGRWLTQDEAEKAAAGWGGDTLSYYEQGNDYLFTWGIKWDTKEDACEFFIAFNNMFRMAAATQTACCQWDIHGSHLTITWNQALNSTIITCSSMKQVSLAG
jgi:hypothetical protein